MSLLQAFAGLALPVVLGAVAGVLRLFPQPDAAISVLNRYALYIAFPALIAVGFTAEGFAIPTEPAFWLVVPAAMVATAAVAGALGRLGALRGQGGTLALVGVFGNVAYVGLPLCERLLGPEVLGLASLAVALFVTCSLALGPALLLRWSPSGGRRPVLRRIAGQPLLWSPLVGLVLRALPIRELVRVWIEPIGASAAPVALFLLGLYLHGHARRALRPDLGSVAHVALKLAVLPGLVIGGGLLLHAQGLLALQSAQVFALLAATPTAIAAFGLAVELEEGTDRVAQAIAASTLVSAVTLPVVGAWVVGWS